MSQYCLARPQQSEPQSTSQTSPSFKKSSINLGKFLTFRKTWEKREKKEKSYGIPYAKTQANLIGTYNTVDMSTHAKCRIS
jgi:hypothetical protein